MARPTKAKEAKPKKEAPQKEDGGSQSAGGPYEVNLLLMALIIVLCSSVSSAAAVYFLAPMALKPMLGTPAAEGEEAAAEEEEAPKEPEKPTVGPVIDLEEFTVNLNDAGGSRYLRADISITVTADDPEFEKLEGEKMKVWEETFHHEMGHYVPTIRDIVISSLTRRSSAELSSTQGKEQVKQEIAQQVDGILHGKHHVIRVNLENFIIQ